MFLEWENNSGKFQNNAIDDVKQISLSHVIIYRTPPGDCFWKVNSIKKF